MNNSNNTIVRRFWSHVYNMPDNTGFYVRNESPNQGSVVVPVFSSVGATAVTTPPVPYLPLSWRHSGYLVAEAMMFLESLGVKKGDRVAILAWNSPEWVWIDLAIKSLGGTTVPIYPNSASDQVNYILNDSGTKVLLTDAQEQIEKVNPDSGVKTFFFDSAFVNAFDYSGAKVPVSFTESAKRDLTPSREAEERVFGILDQLYVGSELNNSFLGINRDDIATLIYTSGSTGQPKGVIQLHSTITAACEAIGRHGFDLSPDDLYLSYLPPAHIYENVDGMSPCLWYGVPGAYCAVEDMASVVKLVKPTILLGVPKVWRKVKSKSEQLTGLQLMIKNWAFQQTNPGLMKSIADFLVFRKIRAGLGGRIRLMLSGGSAISEDILDFFGQVFEDHALLIEGWGLTETAGAATINKPHANKIGTVGVPLDCIQLRIEQLEGHPPGHGIIWIKGDTVTPGYWKLPEENEKAFKDGWFNTGDIGFIDDDGYLKITGRFKRLLKTDGGKYIPIEKLEGAFDPIDLIEYVVPVCDDDPFVGALIFISQEEGAKVLEEAGVTIPSGVDLAEFYANHDVITRLVKQHVGRVNDSLERWETIKQYTIVNVFPTVENGLATTKRTIKTEAVSKRYHDLIRELFTRKKGDS